ncbi:predicted protein [Uncinocarpus reesii 1704]|uniref:Uncharacterized protein n=1 Tax=Uncinocarpus reesii (strain UAMH 1704) TaxID=336963 RepID=C4JQK4_UNCRE|nr:uncharacterized protein UREG_03349 [Uncinocarpus reesii 1704]EEP78503.1 predicted protein [Uncinocarpus reesii 1704]
MRLNFSKLLFLACLPLLEAGIIPQAVSVRQPTDIQRVDGSPASRSREFWRSPRNTEKVDLGTHIGVLKNRGGGTGGRVSHPVVEGRPKPFEDGSPGRAGAGTLDIPVGGKNAPDSAGLGRIQEPKAQPRPEPRVTGDWGYFHSAGKETKIWADKVLETKQKDVATKSYENMYDLTVADRKFIINSDVADLIGIERKFDLRLHTLRNKKDFGNSYEDGFHKDGKFIMATAIYKGSNTKVQKVNWGDAVWPSWKSVAGDKTGDLRWVIQDSIANVDTREIIRSAHGKVGYDRQQPGARFFYEGADDTMKEAFLALSGTDNVRGTWRLTANHREALGDKTVVNIYSFPKGPDLVMELGQAPKVTPPQKRATISPGTTTLPLRTDQRYRVFHRGRSLLPELDAY